MSLLSTQRCVYSGQSLPSNIPTYAKWLLVWKAGFLDQSCRARAAQFKGGTKELLFISKAGWQAPGLHAAGHGGLPLPNFHSFLKIKYFVTPILQNGT